MSDNGNINNLLCALVRDDLESQHAYESLYDLYYKPVFLFAVTLTNNVQTAEDVAQEVFITLKRKASDFNDISSGRAWIFSITKNISRYFLRTSRSEEVKIQSITPKNTEFEKESLNNIVISDALVVLNSKEYQIILLHIFVGFSLKEIADNTGIPYGTVLWRYHEAKKKLKKYYSQEDLT